MRHLRRFGVGLFLLSSLNVFAVQRTFVSAATGSDANTCTRQAPCRNFNAAIALTDAGGEVVALDSGGYGATSVTQSVQLVAPSGVHAAITALSGEGITIDAPSAFVRIRGLSVNGGSGGATSGIHVYNAVSVLVEHVSVTNFSSPGLQGEAAAFYSVQDSTFAKNGHGVYISVGSGATSVAVDHTVIEKNTNNGLVMTGPPVRAVLTNSSILGNASHGIYCSGGQLTVESSVVAFHTAFNTAGLYATDGCTSRVSNSTFMSNYNGLQNYGSTATILSRSNNTIADSTSPTVGTVGTYGAQ